MERRPSTPGSPRGGAGAASWREGCLLFALALGVRLVAMEVLGSPARAAGATPWEWGWESASLARSLADGEFFGDTWAKGSGPSGWLTPVYPGLVALGFELFDGVNPALARALFFVHSLVSAATCLLLVSIGRSLSMPRAGRLAGWAFAFYPTSIWNAVANPWDTTLVAGAITAFVALLVRGGRAPGLERSAALGTAFGAVVFLNPAPASLLPGALLWLAPRGEKPLTLARIGLLLLAAFLVCAPWMLRNRTLLGSPNLRTNLGVELRVGNNDLADGRHQTDYHPSHSDREFARYRTLGEVQYVERAGAEAREWIAEHPGRFAGLVLRRAAIFWIGEPPLLDQRTRAGLRAVHDPNAWIKWACQLTTGVAAVVALIVFPRGPERRLLGWSLALFGWPYYLTHVMERYRFPIDPLIILLDAWLVIRIVDRWRGQRRLGVRPQVPRQGRRESSTGTLT